MGDFIEIIEGILAIIGIFSVIFALKNEDDFYSEITIIKNPNKEELDKYHYIVEGYRDVSLNGEKVLIASRNKVIKDIKVFRVDFENGKIKRKEVLYSYKKLIPNNALLFDIYYSCGMPSRCIRWRRSDGAIGELFLQENNYNGNNDYQIIKYKKSFLSFMYKIFKK